MIAVLRLVVEAVTRTQLFDINDRGDRGVDIAGNGEEPADFCHDFLRDFAILRLVAVLLLILHRNLLVLPLGLAPPHVQENDEGDKTDDAYESEKPSETG